MKTMIDLTRARAVLSGFPEKRVLVVGDIMLDEFLWGECERISPEAPVPVVRIASETFRLGGACNVAHNVVTLGGQVVIVGVVGKDRFADYLADQMEKAGINTEGIFCDPERPTTVKTRVVAHSQQVVRTDRESGAPISDEIETRMVSLVQSLVADQDAVIVSDYAKGVVTDRFTEALLSCARNARVPVFVDPSVKNFYSYKGVTLIVPNTLKSKLLTHIEPRDEQSREEVARRIAGISESSVLLTLGESGMMLFHEGAFSSIPAAAHEVYDVTGASDTVITTCSLSHTAGASMTEAAVLANFAAGVAVGKIGTATVTVKEILKEVRIKLDELNATNET